MCQLKHLILQPHADLASAAAPSQDQLSQLCWWGLGAAQNKHSPAAIMHPKHVAGRCLPQFSNMTLKVVLHLLAMKYCHNQQWAKRAVTG